MQHFLLHPPAGPQEAALDTQVYYFMRTLIGDKLVILLGDHICSASLWAAISSLHTASADTAVQELKRELYQIRLQRSIYPIG